MVQTLAIGERCAVGSEITQVLRGKLNSPMSRLRPEMSQSVALQNGMTIHSLGCEPLHGSRGDIWAPVSRRQNRKLLSRLLDVLEAGGYLAVTGRNSPAALAEG